MENTGSRSPAIGVPTVGAGAVPAHGNLPVARFSILGNRPWIDQLETDAFYRYNQTLQRFFDGAACFATSFPPTRARRAA